MIFGIVLIVSSLIQVADWLTPRYYNYYKDIFQPLPQELIRLRYLISCVRRLSGLVVGIGVLCNKDIFRKLLIFISWFTLLTLYWKHPFFAVQNHARYVLKQMSGIAGSCGFVTLPSERFLTAVSLAGLYAIDIVFSALVIYYFTRPSIKEWFK